LVLVGPENQDIKIRSLTGFLYFIKKASRKTLF